MRDKMDHIDDDDDDDDKYIDLELSTSSNLFCHSNSPPPQATEFEFQTFSFVSSDQDSESTILPADKLFHQGKLLPLHLPPRLQLLQNLLHNSTTTTSAQSCSVSPSESFRLTADQLNDYLHKSTGGINDHFVDVDITKKSWSRKKLKLIKKFLVGQKLKHVKSLFSKSNCSNEACGKEAVIKEETANSSKGKNNDLNKYIDNIPGGHIEKKATFPTVMNLSSNEKVRFQNTSNISHRKSFSGAIKQHSTSSSSRSSSSSSTSSSSFSFRTNRVDGLNLHTRRGSAGLPTELGVESAIAHCKLSQQNMVAEARFWSFSVSETADCIKDQDT